MISLYTGTSYRDRAPEQDTHSIKRIWLKDGHRAETGNEFTEVDDSWSPATRHQPNDVYIVRVNYSIFYRVCNWVFTRNVDGSLIFFVFLIESSTLKICC